MIPLEKRRSFRTFILFLNDSQHLHRRIFKTEHLCNQCFDHNRTFPCTPYMVCTEKTDVPAYDQTHVAYTWVWSYAGTSVRISSPFTVLFGYLHKITTNWWIFWRNWLPCCVIWNSSKFRWELSIRLTWNRIFLFDSLSSRSSRRKDYRKAKHCNLYAWRLTNAILTFLTYSS